MDRCTLEKEILNIISGEIGRKVEINEVLSESELNSVVFVKIILNLEKRFGIRVEDEELLENDFSGIRSVVDFVAGKVESIELESSNI